MQKDITHALYDAKEVVSDDRSDPAARCRLHGHFFKVYNNIRAMILLRTETLLWSAVRPSHVKMARSSQAIICRILLYFSMHPHCVGYCFASYNVMLSCSAAALVGTLD